MLPYNTPEVYPASLILGIFYGLTFCTSACLPYITSYIASIGAGFRRGVVVAAVYNSGRIMAYALIGILIALFRSLISEAFLPIYQRYATFAFGFAIALIGISLLVKRGKSQLCCRNEEKIFLDFKKLNEKFDFQAFTMGFLKGLIVCPPLMGILLYSLTSLSPLDVFLSVFLFGLGTVFSPIFLICGVTGWLFNKAPLFSRWIVTAGALILILLGFNAMLSVAIIRSGG